MFFILNKSYQKATAYHHHTIEIVVSKYELLHQLRFTYFQDELLKLLIFGENLPNYEFHLYSVSTKFETLGCLVYPLHRDEIEKPPLKLYIQELFQGNHERYEEVKCEIERLVEHRVSDKFARKVFNKLLFVIYTCCPCMADATEIWWVNTYYHFIKYATQNEEFTFPTRKNINSIYDCLSKEIKNAPIKRTYILQHMPKELYDKIVNEIDIEEELSGGCI